MDRLIEWMDGWRNGFDVFLNGWIDRVNGCIECMDGLDGRIKA